jgi:diaminopimelate epimerase
VRPLLFEKYEGLGNDFVVVEGTPSSLEVSEVRRICDRHRGVGADGVLFTGVSAGRPFMHVVNADGTTAEMCGNGIRCVALHLLRRGLVEDRSFEIDTDAGPHPIRVLEVAAPGRVEVGMRAPTVHWTDRDIAGVKVAFVSMGNPHAVVFDAAPELRRDLGPFLQRDAAFPEQANVGFARLHGTSRIELFVYERGSGWTEACGTGACAAVVAAVETKRVERGARIDVGLPGGTLEIVVGAPGERVRMTGPARHVFSGKVEL